MSNLLPASASTLERDVVDVIASPQPVGIRDIWNPDTCPPRFLPWLAHTFSVDRWDSDWTEAEKRAAINASFFVHRHKGTVAAIRRVVEPLGYLINVIEWWEKTPKGDPHTFELLIGVRDKGITDAVYEQMVSLIYDAKPLRSELLGLDIQGESKGVFYVAVGAYSGDTTTVYPYDPGDVSVYGALYRAASEHTIDKVSVYPL